MKLKEDLWNIEEKDDKVIIDDIEIDGHIIDIIQHCKLITWRTYFERSVDKENTSENSFCTYLNSSESGGTVPLKCLINMEG